MTHTLLVYEMVPDSIRFFLIPNDEIEKNDWLPLLQLAHNKYVNKTDEYNDGMSFLQAALCEEKYINDDLYFNDGNARTREGNRMKKEWRCVLSKYHISGVIENVLITRVIASGFIL